MSKLAKRSLMGTLAMAALGGASASAWQWWRDDTRVATTDNAYVRADLTAISPKVQGYVSAVPVADNQTITAGEVLVRIDDADFRARLAQAEAGIAAARAAIEAQDAAIGNFDSQRAQLEYTRYETLAKLSIAPRQRLEAVAADRRKAAAAVAGARALAAAERGKLAVLASGRKQAEASLQLAQANLAQAEASCTLARIDLANTVIRAPVDGVVAARTVRLGALVQPGTPLLAVVPLDRVWVVANFKETQLARMRPGQPATIRADSFPGVAVKGHVDSFAPASGAEFSVLPPDNATGNFVKVVQRIPVKIRVDPDSPLRGQLRPGMSVSVYISLDPENNDRPAISGLAAGTVADRR